MVTKLWSSGEEDSQCILPKQPYLPWMCCQYHSFLSLWLVLLFLRQASSLYCIKHCVIRDALYMCLPSGDDCSLMVCRGTACLWSRRYEYKDVVIDHYVNIECLV